MVVPANRQIGILAMVVPVWFTAVYLILAGLRPEYSHLTKAISELRQAEKRASLAMRREAEGKQGEALALWAEIMGRYFPTS